MNCRIFWTSTPTAPMEFSNHLSTRSRPRHPGIPPVDISWPDAMATAREKQDAALAAYQLAKHRERFLADVRGQSDTTIPLVVDHDDAELRTAIDDDVTAQLVLSAALRATDD
jgi:hypothetical protein